MKTIEEAAKEYADMYFEERLGNCGARNGFNAGAEYRQQEVDDYKEALEYALLSAIHFLKGNEEDAYALLRQMRERVEKYCN